MLDSLSISMRYLSDSGLALRREELSDFTVFPFPVRASWGSLAVLIESDCAGPTVLDAPCAPVKELAF